MRQIVFVGLFGALGAVVRFLVSAGMRHAFGEAFPLGTLTVNVVGCGLIGVLFQWDDSTHAISAEWRNALAAGFLGGLTTYSTFGLETTRLFELGRWPAAAMNVFANLAVGLLAVRLGMWLVRRWIGGA